MDMKTGRTRPRNQTRTRTRSRNSAVAAVGAAALVVGGLISLGTVAAAAATRSAEPATVQPSASCPSGVVTVNEEDYYGVPKPNTSGGGFNTFFTDFDNANPCIKIVRQDPVITGDSQYLTHVLSQFSSGSQPDLLMLDNPELAEFAADGTLVPLHSLGSLDTSELNPANIAETTYQGQLYAMPLYTNTIAIFYNKTLLAQNGITTLPTTWAQFGADAKKTAHGKDLGFVFSGQAGPGEATWQFDPWSWSNGGSMEAPDSSGSVQALSFLAGLVADGAAPKDVVNWSQAQPIQEFEAGDAAFCENGLWNIPSMQASYPRLKWGVIEIPTRAAGQTVIAPFGGEVWAIPKTTTAEEKAAFTVLKAMSAPSEIVSLAKLDTAVPTEPSKWNQSPWNESVYAPFLAELKNGRSRTAGLKNPANEPAIDLDIGNGIEAALIGKESASAAMTAAASQIAPLLK